MHCRWIFAISLIVLAVHSAPAQDTSQAPWLELGGPRMEGWSGLSRSVSDAATLAIPGETEFVYANGPRGFYNHGFRLENDGTVDWRDFYGPQFEICLADDREVELAVILIAAAPNAPDTQVSSVVTVSGAGWHSLTLPWSAFAFNQAGTSFLRFGKGCSIAARLSNGGRAASIQIRRARIVRAPAVALQCDVRGKSAARGATVSYDIRVSNCTNQPEAVSLSFIHYGWEVMDAKAEPDVLQLSPGAAENIKVRVTVNGR
jgi:hypothetical protein